MTCALLLLYSLETPLREVLGFTENSPFLIIDHIHAKINLVCCRALAIGKKCMNVRKNKLLKNEPSYLTTQRNPFLEMSKSVKVCYYSHDFYI